MINDKNISFVTKYGPSSIHDENIKAGKNLRLSAASRTLTKEQANKIFEMPDTQPEMSARQKQHAIINHQFDKLKPEQQQAMIESQDSALRHIALARIHDHDQISSLIDRNDSDINSSLSQNSNLTDDHRYRILDQMANQKDTFSESDHTQILKDFARQKMSDKTFHKFMNAMDANDYVGHVRTDMVRYGVHTEDQIHKLIERSSPYLRRPLINLASAEYPNFDAKRYLR